MIKQENLPPLYRDVLCTLGIGTRSTTCLVRVKGGYRRKDGGGPVFTTRTINAMERAWLLERDDGFPPTVRLTSQGQQLSERLLHPADAAQAVAS